MATPFDDIEHARILRELLSEGERLFTTQGLRKTSLAELVASSQIAKTSFYRFFPAKESLYLELMIRRAPQIGRKLTAALDATDCRTALVAVMHTIAEILTEDPFYRRLLTHPDEMAAVGRRLGPQEQQRVEPEVMAPLTDFIRRAQRAGDLPDAPVEVILGVLRGIGMTVANRAQYGKDHPAVIELTIQSLAAGLTGLAREEAQS